MNKVHMQSKDNLFLFNSIQCKFLKGTLYQDYFFLDKVCVWGDGGINSRKVGSISQITLEPKSPSFFSIGIALKPY